MKNILEYKEELQKYLKEKNFPYWVEETTDNRLVIEIVWGDWKHDHWRANWLVEEFFKSKNLIVQKEEYTTEEDGSDCYSADHYYWFE